MLKSPRFRAKLLASYVLVIVVGIGGLVLSVQLVGPSIFDRMLGHMGGGHMAGEMTDTMRVDIVDAFRSAMLRALLIATTASVLAAVVVSMVVAQRIIAPITRMVEVSRLFADGDYRARLPGGGNDELGELTNGLNEMATALEDTERRRLHLLGDVAHEVRTPVATLRGYLEGLIDGVIQPSPELWSQLHDETTRLTRLIDDLQELSRVESGQVPINRAELAPDRLLETVNARLAPRFASKGVELVVAQHGELPALWADEDRSLQVVTNLLENSLRYTPSGGVVTLGAQTDGGMLRFTIGDTGVGITAEHLPHLFDRFYRVDPSRSRALGGSGIGLTIAKALVEAQGGRIWAESPGTGQGATFNFTLPCAQVFDTPEVSGTANYEDRG